MSDLISSILHMGIVRVLSVPLAIAGLIYLIWIMAAPPKDDGDAKA